METRITDTIASIDKGGLDHDAGQQLTQLVQELLRASQAKMADAKGHITIKLGLKVSSEGAVTIDASVSKTTPKIPSRPVLRFARKDGALLEAPERQQKLFDRQPEEHS